jgi:ribosome assembly protein RRB1
MGKKSKRRSNEATAAASEEGPTSSTPSLEEEQNRPAPSLRTTEAPTTDELHCEDPYEDLYESEDDASYEDVYESSGDEDDGIMDVERKDQLLPIDENDGNANAPGSGVSSKAAVTSWNPFQSNAENATNLEMDESAYKMHHALTPEWPSLSLDIIPDRHLGDNRTRFPHVVTMVVGTQTDRANKVTLLRMSDLCRMAREKTEKELDDEMLGEEWNNNSEEEEDDSSSSEEEEELDPVLEHYTFPHDGGVNRIRVCPQNSDVVAVWGEKGTVSLYDVGGALDLLDRSTMSKTESVANYQVRKMRKDPFFVYSGHSNEGYALDWSRVVPGRLASADCDGHIHIWNATHPVASKDVTSKASPWGNSSFEIKPTYSPSGDNIDHPSVEDLQWSPNEATVLASAECGGYVRIYDIRCPNRAMITNKIHTSGADVNVISWNRLVSNLLASGGDDGEYVSQFFTPALVFELQYITRVCINLST